MNFVYFFKTKKILYTVVHNIRSYTGLKLIFKTLDVSQIKLNKKKKKTQW